MVGGGESAVRRQCWRGRCENKTICFTAGTRPFYQHDPIQLNCQLGLWSFLPQHCHLLIAPGKLWGCCSTEKSGGKRHLGVTRGIPHMSQPHPPSPDAAGARRNSKLNSGRIKRKNTQRKMLTEEVVTKNKKVSREMLGQNINEGQVERRFNTNLELNVSARGRCNTHKNLIVPEIDALNPSSFFLWRDKDENWKKEDLNHLRQNIPDNIINELKFYSFIHVQTITAEPPTTTIKRCLSQQLPSPLVHIRLHHTLSTHTKTSGIPINIVGHKLKVLTTAV